MGYGRNGQYQFMYRFEIGSIEAWPPKTIATTAAAPIFRRINADLSGARRSLTRSWPG
jgi:hypothetical protein